MRSLRKRKKGGYFKCQTNIQSIMPGRLVFATAALTNLDTSCLVPHGEGERQEILTFFQAAS